MTKEDCALKITTSKLPFFYKTYANLSLMSPTDMTQEFHFFNTGNTTPDAPSAVRKIFTSVGTKSESFAR